MKLGTKRSCFYRFVAKTVQFHLLYLNCIYRQLNPFIQTPTLIIPTKSNSKLLDLYCTICMLPDEFT